VEVQRLWKAESKFRPPLLVGLALAITCIAAAERDLFDQIYERGQKHNAGLKTLTATFTETSTSSLLTTPLVARGTVSIERPSRVVLRYTEPDTRILLIDADKMTLSWPSAHVHTVTDIGASQRRVQKYFVDSSPAELRTHFEIAARVASDRPGAYQVTMVPKRKQLQQGLKQLDLWIDKTTIMLSAMRMTFPNGDTKLMTFTDVKTNPQIDPSVFKIDGASGR
jgi:outer membrane lipoprotein-sorting protein